MAVFEITFSPTGGTKILVVVYGNRAYDDTFAELRDALTEAGFSCIAGIAAVAEHSIMHQFAAGRPNRQDETELVGFAEKIRSKMESDALPEYDSFPGNRPYRAYSGVPMKPAAGRGCTKCGLCETECPVGVISAEDPGITDSNICISCMRCITVCPSQARSVNKALLLAGSMILKKECSAAKRNELYL